MRKFLYLISMIALLGFSLQSCKTKRGENSSEVNLSRYDRDPRDLNYDVLKNYHLFEMEELRTFFKDNNQCSVMQIRNLNGQNRDDPYYTATLSISWNPSSSDRLFDGRYELKFCYANSKTIGSTSRVPIRTATANIENSNSFNSSCTKVPGEQFWYKIIASVKPEGRIAQFPNEIKISFFEKSDCKQSEYFTMETLFINENKSNRQVQSVISRETSIRTTSNNNSRYDQNCNERDAEELQLGDLTRNQSNVEKQRKLRCIFNGIRLTNSQITFGRLVNLLNDFMNQNSSNATFVRNYVPGWNETLQCRFGSNSECDLIKMARTRIGENRDNRTSGIMPSNFSIRYNRSNKLDFCLEDSNYRLASGYTLDVTRSNQNFPNGEPVYYFDGPFNEDLAEDCILIDRDGNVVSGLIEQTSPKGSSASKSIGLTSRPRYLCCDYYNPKFGNRKIQRRRFDVNARY